MAVGAQAGGPSQRIVGGDVANPADWPFAAALTSRRGKHFCGGSVISADAVVTAAHCVAGARKRQIRVVTGRPDLDDGSVGAQTKVTGITVNREYPRKGHRDVAVLNLRYPTAATPVLLPTHEEEAEAMEPGDEFRVAGWGGTDRDGGSPSDVLLDVSVFAISDKECGTHFDFFRPSEEVCAFGEQKPNGNYNDSCFGDSGGPLVADAARGALLIGIVSYGGPFCGVKKPGVYQQVARNIGFIKRHAGLP
jgi:secreted trypsin-like serine protease